MPNMDVRTLATAKVDTPYPLFMDYEYKEIGESEDEDGKKDEFNTLHPTQLQG